MIKPETITVVIYPSAAAADTLIVADAMHQVLDAFELLSKAEAERSDSKQRVVWRLERASTNTPLTIQALAVSSDPEGAIEEQAHQAKIALAEGLESLLLAKRKPEWIDDGAEKIVRRILERTLNGIGRTDVRLDDQAAPIVIDHRSASRAMHFLDMKAAEAAARIEDLTRTEYGAAEGHVTGTTTYYRKPAFTIKERLSGSEIRCVLSGATAEKIGRERSWDEVWTGQRVLVSGTLHYNSEGALVLVDVEEVAAISPRDVSAREIQDPSFSGGLTPVEHLDRVWGNSDG